MTNHSHDNRELVTTLIYSTPKVKKTNFTSNIKHMQTKAKSYLPCFED